MTFQDGGNFESGRVKRRSGGGKAVAGGGLGLIVLFLIGRWAGVDLTQLAPLLDGGSSTSTQEEVAVTGCDTASDANENDLCRYDWTVQSLDAFWSQELERQTGTTFTEPGAATFSGTVSTGCGSASSASGPFYCPADQTIYIDTGFYKTLRTDFNTTGGPLAQMYITAHEYGHHIENITGVLGSANRRDSGADSDSVKVELMADCLAGMWAGNAATTPNPATGQPDLKPITKAQLKDALDAAAAVGDDRIQEAAYGEVNEHSFTHGSSEQRQEWFLTGYNGGDFNACNTFTAGN